MRNPTWVRTQGNRISAAAKTLTPSRPISPANHHDSYTPNRAADSPYSLSTQVAQASTAALSVITTVANCDEAKDS